MANRWTSEQLAAINARGANLLVSAAAGSGKTAVLVERIIKKITDEQNPVDIDRLLVVTFTNAAAAEMRERITDAIAQKLEENPSSSQLARQMTLAAKANITTIHSFCMNILRTNFNVAGIDPNFRIADTTENQLLRIEALDEVVDEMYEDDEFADVFYTLLENYSSVKNRAGFDEMIEKIYNFVMSLPNPEGWLADAAEKFSCEKFAGSKLAQDILECAKERMREIILRYNDVLEKAKNDDGGDNVFLMLLSEKECLSHLLEAKDYKEAHEWAQSVSFARFPTAPKKSEPIYREYIKNIRKKAVEEVNKNINKALLLLTEEEQERVLKIQYEQMKCLSELVKRLICRFNEKKEEKNLLNFNDLEHICYRILTDACGKPSQLAKAIGEQYEEILIDEYQDTSRLQEAIFAAIKKENNLFMVGDIKQSIYRFRNTDPLLFRDKKDTFSADEEAIDRKIILSKNFRSRREILAGINDIFERIMSVGAGEIDYNEEEKLYVGADYPETPHPIKADLQLHVIETVKRSESDNDEIPMEQIEVEAHLAAKQIAQILSGGYQVLTKSGYRTVTYRDICIILRKTKGWSDTFMQVFADYGIPCYSETGGGFLQSTEVEIMMSLLEIIDNPYQDLPLLSVLRSLMYGFTTNDLAEIRVCDRKGTFYDALKAKAQEDDRLAKAAASFIEQLKKFREYAGFMSLSELIWSLYSDTGFYDAQGAQPDGILRQSNLRLLAMRAEEYEKTGFRGLYNFVRFVDKYKSAGGDYDSARQIGEEQNVVRIMSIHKSKGLEFPIVFLCGAGKQINLRDLSKNILIHPELGYGPKFIDPDLRITYKTAVRAAVAEQLRRETLSEEMRVLYVALTRAREKLIVIGSSDDVHKRVYSLGSGVGTLEKIPPHKVLAANSYLDWFMMALLNHPNCAALRDSIDYEVKLSKSESPWSVTLHTNDGLNEETTEAERAIPDEKQNVNSKELIKLIRYNYPHMKDTALPTKITVTELKNKNMRDEDPMGIYLYPKPRFLQQGKKKIGGARRGTAFHTVMQRLDLAKTSEDDIESQIQVLVEKGYLTQEEGQVVDKEKIVRFFDSGIGKIMLGADKVLREVLFAINIPAKEAEPGYDGDEEIMLQGVIDCVIIKDDEITILDYKTEHIEDEEKVAQKYAVQLHYYARAAEKIYNLPVRAKYLYLFETENTLSL